MVLHVFISFLGGVPLCILYGLYSVTSLGGTTRGILGEFSGWVLSVSVPVSVVPVPICHCLFFHYGYRYQLVWYRYQYGIASISSLGTGTN